MGNSFASYLPQTPNDTEQLENAESRANPLPPFTAPHRVDISTVPVATTTEGVSSKSSPPVLEGPAAKADDEEAPGVVSKDFNVKLLGFGLKSLGHKSKNILSQKLYLPPEYPSVGRIADHWSHEGDVFSFGVVLLKLMKGNKLDNSADLNVTRVTLQYFKDNKSDPKKLKSKLEKLIDEEIKHEYAPDKALQMTIIIKKCLAVNPKERPISFEILKEFD
ncbi:hypothetical protein ACE6H2_024778 [Prunus campanulata]